MCGVGQTLGLWGRSDPWGVAEARNRVWVGQTLGVRGETSPYGVLGLGGEGSQTLRVRGRPDSGVRVKPDPVGVGEA